MKVAYFRGTEGLEAAGQQLFDDSELDIAVVRGFADRASELMDACTASPNFNQAPYINQDSEEYARLFEAQIPEIKVVDGIITQWYKNWAENSRYLVEPRLKYGWLRPSGITPHFDLSTLVDNTTYSEGPLTISMRLDSDSDKHRVFYASRQNKLNTADPTLTLDEVAAQQDAIIVAAEANKFRDMASVVQRPGDIIIMLNNPTPTLHKVDAESGTWGLVTTYCIKAKD
jgi:hypothetical protein